jgi:hypothetical protein
MRSIAIPKRNHHTDSLLKPKKALLLAKGVPLSVPIVSVPVTWVTDYSGGECQESCRFASGAAVLDPRGLRVTDSTGAQFRVEPVHRSGFRLRAR